MPIYVMPHNNICYFDYIYCYGALHYYFVEAGLKSFPLFDGDADGSRVCFCFIVCITVYVDHSTCRSGLSDDSGWLFVFIQFISVFCILLFVFFRSVADNQVFGLTAQQSGINSVVVERQGVSFANLQARELIQVLRISRLIIGLQAIGNDMA